MGRWVGRGSGWGRQRGVEGGTATGERRGGPTPPAAVMETTLAAANPRGGGGDRWAASRAPSKEQSPARSVRRSCSFFIFQTSATVDRPGSASRQSLGEVKYTISLSDRRADLGTYPHPDTGSTEGPPRHPPRCRWSGASSNDTKAGARANSALTHSHPPIHAPIQYGNSTYCSGQSAIRGVPPIGVPCGVV